MDGEIRGRLCGCACGRSLEGKRRDARFFGAACRTRASRVRRYGPAQERGFNLIEAGVRRDLERAGLLGDQSQRAPDPKAPVPAERSVPLETTTKILQRPLWWLEALDFAETQRHRSRLCQLMEDEPLAVIPSLGGNKELISHKRINQCIEEKDLTNSEVLERVNSMEARLAESLNSIQWELRILLGRYPDHPELREAVEGWLADN